jgi:ABC-2 type transport system permease protein
MRKLYVPSSVFVVSAIGSAVVNFTFALAPLFLLTLLNGITPTVSWLLLIVPAVLTAVFSLGIGLIVGGLFVLFRDVFEIYQVLISAFSFLTPIMYPLSILPEPARGLEQWNPLFLFIETFRDVLIKGTLSPTPTLGIEVAMSLGALLVGWTLFTRLEAKFALYL